MIYSSQDWGLDLCLQISTRRLDVLGLEDVQVTWGGAKPEALAVAENWGDPAWLVDDYRGLYYLSFIEDYNPIIYPLVLKKIIHHNLQMDLKSSSQNMEIIWDYFGKIMVDYFGNPFLDHPS